MCFIHVQLLNATITITQKCPAITSRLFALATPLFKTRHFRHGVTVLFHNDTKAPGNNSSLI
jgi:hypothetical protein